MTRETVQLSRDNGSGDWTPVETTRVDENATHNRFESSAVGFSVFAIGTGAQSLDVRMPEEPGEVTVGDQAILAAVVKNRGAVDREYNLTLTFDGAVVTSDSGTVEWRFKIGRPFVRPRDCGRVRTRCQR